MFLWLPPSQCFKVEFCRGELMRVAYVCMDPGIPVWGNKGCSIHVQGVLRALVRKGIHIDLIALRTGGDCPVGLESVELHLIDATMPKAPWQREQVLCQLNENVCQLLDELTPPDFIYERYSLFAGAGVEFAHYRGIPGFLEVNAPLVTEHDQYRVLVDRESAFVLTRRAFCAASTVIAVSEAIADHLFDYGVPEERVCILPNAIDPG